MVAAVVLAAIALAACWHWRERLRGHAVAAIGLGVAVSLAFSPYVGIVDLGLLTLTAVVWTRRSAAEPIAALLLVDAAWAVDFLAGSGRIPVLPVALLLFVLVATWRVLWAGAGRLQPDLAAAGLSAPG